MHSATFFATVLAVAGFAAAKTCASCPETIGSGASQLTLVTQGQYSPNESRYCGYNGPDGKYATACSYFSDGAIDYNQNGECPATTTTYTSDSCLYFS